MTEGMAKTGEKAVRGLYRLGNSIVCITGSAIFLFLTFFSLVFTQYMLPGEAEVPLNKPDSILWNLLALAAAGGVSALLLYLERRLGGKASLRAARISGGVMLLWILAAGGWWICSSAHLPQGDQAYIYGGASYFMEGNYDFLAPGGYCDMYPYQLGLIALCELLFGIAGAFNYYAFEWICVALSAGCAYFGYRIVWEITGSGLAVTGYNMLMMGCLPLIFYTPWVYGDIPGIFFGMLAAWMLLAYGRKGRTGYLAAAAAALVFAMLVRKNSLILLTAAGIAAVLHGLRHRDRRPVLAFLAAVLLSWGVYAGIYKGYEVRSGYAHSDGLPFVVWIATGMEETKGTCGWDNDYYKQVYFESGHDREAAAAAARENLRQRLQIFVRDPVYAGKFFGRKVLSQWNGPLYQALYFNAESPQKQGGPRPDSLAAELGGKYYGAVLAFCDRWQFIVYTGMLCYFLLAVKKESSLLQHVTAITIIGGFFYSVISEGKGRYIFPYYVMMFPFAAYGLREAMIGMRAKARGEVSKWINRIFQPMRKR